MASISPSPKLQFFDANGDPLVAGKLYTYAAGTTTPLTTYQSASGAANTNPIILDSRGEANVWLGTSSYKFALFTATDVPVWTVDDLSAATTIASLAASSGASLVGFIQTGTGAVARTVQAKLRETVSIDDYGADSSGVTSSHSAILNALQSGAQMVYVPKGTYTMSTNISVTLTTNVVFYGEGRITYSGTTNSNPMIAVETGNNDFTVTGISFDGNDLIASGMRIYNTATPSANTYPNCTVQDCLFIKFRMNVAGIWNEAVYVAGTFQLVTIARNKVRLITRAAGTGTPGSTGTSGIVVTTYSATQYARACVHTGNSYARIQGDDLVGSTYNVDYDAFKFFAPDPTNFSGAYPQSTLTSFGNTYRNCRGRALKIQAVGSVWGETIIRDDDYTIYNGSDEINFQWGVGEVSNCTFIYQGSTGYSPIQTGVTLVSFYQGVDYGEYTGSAVVNGLQVLNSIDPGVGSSIGPLVGATVGSGVADPYKPLVSISNVSVNKNPVSCIATIGYGASTYGTLRMDSIVVPKVDNAAVLTNGTDTNFDIVATNVVNIDGVSTPANAKPFVLTTLLAPVVYGGVLSGALNQGFLATYNVSSDTNKAPMLAGAAVAAPDGVAGGAVSVQSTTLADDGSYEFAARFYNTSRGLFAISVDYEYTSQGLFATGSNQVYKIAVPLGDVFQASTTGTNPDVDNKFNVWYTGGKLNVKNRLGQSVVATVTFMG